MQSTGAPEAQPLRDGQDSIPRSWTLDDIPYSNIDPSLLRGQAVWFHLLVAASFVETDTPLYTSLLLEHFAEHQEAQQWLREQWLVEEVQHGRALHTYVEQVWPEFDWERAYRHFSEQYAKVANVEHLEPDRGLEMVSRCVVEVGTSTLYLALSNCAEEPVLRQLCHRIAQDEVRHYTYFLRFFEDYAARHPYRRWSVLRAECSRLAEVAREDMVIATGCTADGLPAGHPLRDVNFADLRRESARLLQPAYPARMGVLMLLKPLRLGTPLRRALVPVLARAATLALRR